MWQWLIADVAILVLLLVLWSLLVMAARAEEADDREAAELMKRGDNG
jgi:hypothetical protein